MSIYVSHVIHADTAVEVSTQDGTVGPIASFSLYAGDDRYGARVTVQGDPEVMIALLDRLRTEMVGAVGAAWPVEQAHAETVTV